jgi:electron transport complex protein RnfE
MNTPSTPSLDITWRQPAFLLPLFCLCPLLAATTSLAIGIGLAAVLCITTIITMLVTQTTRAFIPDSTRSFAWLMICSSITAIIELSLHAWNYPLFRALDLFLPLTVIAPLLIARTEMQAEQTSAATLAMRAVKMNAGFLLAAIVVGSARELIGDGALFSDAAAILGTSAPSIVLFPKNMGFLLAVLAPGAFIGLGLGVALYNWLWIHMPRKKTDHA